MGPSHARTQILGDNFIVCRLDWIQRIVMLTFTCSPGDDISRVLLRAIHQTTGSSTEARASIYSWHSVIACGSACAWHGGMVIHDDPNSNKCMCAWDCSVFIRGAPVRFLSQPPRPWSCRCAVDVPHAFGRHEARGTPHAPPTTHHAPRVPCNVDIQHWMPRLAFPLRRRESISMLRSSPTRKLL